MKLKQKIQAIIQKLFFFFSFRSLEFKILSFSLNLYCYQELRGQFPVLEEVSMDPTDVMRVPPLTCSLGVPSRAEHRQNKLKHPVLTYCGTILHQIKIPQLSQELNRGTLDQQTTSLQLSQAAGQLKRQQNNIKNKHSLLNLRKNIGQNYLRAKRDANVNRRAS